VTRAESEVLRKTALDAERQIAEAVAALRKSCGNGPVGLALPDGFAERLELPGGVRIISRDERPS
jgi:hypothetical protein